MPIADARPRPAIWWIRRDVRLHDTTPRASMTPIEQQAAGCLLGREYPEPIVEHRAVRERTLAAYKDAQAGA